ncbi:MAG: aspartyl protease family protein [Candidatus Cybelea sp.]
MQVLVPFGLLAFAAFILPRPAAAVAAWQCDAAPALSGMRAAVGGARWNDVTQIAAYGTATMSGLRGSAQFDDDLVRGRYARRFRIAVMGSSDEIYDGSTTWVKDISGGVHPYDSPYAREQSVTNAYLARRGYFDRRSPASFTCLGTRVADGRSEVVIRVQPNGGSPAELAIDARTHLLASITQRAPLERSVVTYADYRIDGGLVLPFSISSGTAKDPADDYAFTVRRYELLHSVRSADFSKPVAREAIRLLGGATSTTVPMMLEGRQLMVWASLDRRPEMPFILDTGGQAILTMRAAKRLGLAAAGAGEGGGSGAGTISTAFTRVRSVRIGSAELLDQPFLVISSPYSFYERGKRTPLAGILGLEFFERFAVRLDYGDRTVTLTPLSTFRVGRGTQVPFTFESDPNVPMVAAAADGYHGLFGVDTGNARSIHLYGTFLERTGLDARYSGGALSTGHGQGGTNTGRTVKLHSFTLAGHVFHGVEANFTKMKTGAFSAWTQAGNLGFTILSRFIPTFDYARQILYLAPEHRVTPIPPNRSGLAFEKNEPAAFDVAAVKPGSAAATAGIVAGDRILAIDGKSAADFSRADLLGIVTQAAGTVVSLRVLRSGTTRDVTLTLH